MKSLWSVILAATCFLLISSTGFSSHVAGGNVKYTYVGPGSTPGTHKYKVKLGMIRDCNGISYSTQSETLTAYCTSTASSLTFTVNKINYVPKPGERPSNGGAKDISNVCRSKSTRCAGPGNPGGYEEIIYEGFIDLAPCNRWEIYLGQSQCCRSLPANITGSYFSPWVSLSSGDFPKNSSTDFLYEFTPLPAGCTGQTFSYYVGASDRDKDSLSYRLVRGRNSQNGRNVTYLVYRNGASHLMPIPGFNLDSITGLMTFQTNATGKYIVAFEVIEYDRCSGKEKGRTHREIAFDVRNCSNRIPRDISGISNLSSNATKNSSHSLSVCQGETISWNDTIEDGDVTDTLWIRTNMSDQLKGGTWNITRLARNKAVINFKWKANIIDGEYKLFYILYDDDRCDFPGQGTSVISVRVTPSANVGEDVKLCQGDTAFLEVEGGRKFDWTVLSGSAINPGVNWFADTNATDTNRTARFIPSQTTVLVAKTDTVVNNCGRKIETSCFKSDTLTIFVADSFRLTTSPDQVACNPASGQLDVIASKSNLNYSYQWTPAANLTADTIRNPMFSSLTKNTKFSVQVVSDSGCSRTAHINIGVSDPFPQNMSLTASDTLVCIAKTIDLAVDKGSINYGACGAVQQKCLGDFKDYTTGPGSNLNNSVTNQFPMTYRSTALGVKSQYLYRASDLKNMGMEAGPINSISFEIDSLPPGLDTLKGFSVKIGCSTLNSSQLNSFETGLTVVQNASDYIPQKGWNTHVFDNQYNWDGISNIIVEICWQKDSAGGPNVIQKWDLVGYRSASTYFQQAIWNQAPCQPVVTAPTIQVNVLPRTRWNACTGLRNSLFTFNWSPISNGGFVGTPRSDSAVANVNLSTAKTYSVVVKDSAYGVCSDTLSLNVNVVSKYDVTPRNKGPFCLYDGTIVFLSNTPHNITSPGGKWSGLGITDTIRGYWDPKKTGAGQYYVTYEVTGDACANKDSTLFTIEDLPNANFSGPDSMCHYVVRDTNLHRLFPALTGGFFSGTGVDTFTNGSGQTVFYLNPSSANPQVGKPDTLWVKHVVQKACSNEMIKGFKVLAPWDSTYAGAEYDKVVYPTDSFCSSSSITEFLQAAGPNPVWTCLTEPTAIINSTTGEFSPINAFGSARNKTVEVELANHGFCGSKDTITLYLIEAPEIEIVPEIYCNSGVFDTSNFFARDTVFFRIPKGPQLVGSAAKTRLDTNGFDPATEVKVIYGYANQTGWGRAYDNAADRYLYNSWDGKPWMNTPNLAWFRTRSLPYGKNPIRYRFSISYRQNHPYHLCSSYDSAVVIRDSVLPIQTLDTYNLCNQSLVVLNAGKFNEATYNWSTGDTTPSINVGQVGTYSVNVQTKWCNDSKTSRVVVKCTGIENHGKRIETRLYPNPNNGLVYLAWNQNLSSSVSVSVFDLTGKLVQNRELDQQETQGEVTLDLRDLPDGNYLIRVFSEEVNSTFKAFKSSGSN